MKKLISILILTILLTGGIALPLSLKKTDAGIGIKMAEVEAKKKKKKNIAPIQLSGNGQTATQVFTLEKGISIFEITHTGGESNFSVILRKSNGEWVDLLVNEIGNYSGKKAVGIDSKGTYLLDIEADGNWTVNITQPRPSSGVKKPINFTGTGDDVPQFMYFKKKGLARFNMSHSGESNFVVWLFNEKGNRVDLLVNEIGNYNGSTSVRIPKKGVYLLDITADGSWSISIN